MPSRGTNFSHWLLGRNMAQRTWARASLRLKYRCPEAGRVTLPSSPSTQTSGKALSSRSRASVLSWAGVRTGFCSDIGAYGSAGQDSAAACVVPEALRAASPGRAVAAPGSAPQITNHQSRPSMPLQRPGHMLPYQLRRVLAARFQRGDDFRRGRSVAQGHGDVAQPALVAAAADRAALGAAQELLLFPGEQLGEGGLVEVVAGAEVRLVGAPRELVPGTHQLAVVAAEDAVADRRAQLLRDPAVVLDGQVGDATPRIQPVGRGDRPGRTGGDAAAAGAAMRAGRRIHRQRQVQVNLAEEEPGAAVLVDQAGVLADPAQPGVAPQCALQHRRRVHEHAVAEGA